MKSEALLRETEPPEVDTSLSAPKQGGQRFLSRGKLSELLLSTTTLSFLLLAVGVALALRYQGYLSAFREFGDESETIVAARMILSGRKLYSGIFNHHGPLVFLPGVLLGFFGNVNIAGHRIFVFMLQWLSLGAVYFSPVLRSWTARNLVALATLTVWTVYLPDVLGHMYMYQTLTGLTLVVILASYVFPSLLSPEVLSRWQVALGNALIACLPFFAVTYIPAAGLLFLAGFRKVQWKRSLVWLAVGCLFNLGFLTVAGSIKGFMAYHLYLNSQILPQYQPGGDSSVSGLLKVVFESLSSDFLQFGLIALLAAVGGVLARGGNWIQCLRATAVSAAVASLLLRGHSFHGLPFYYVCCVLPLVFFPEVKAFLWPQTLGWTVLAVAGLLKLSLAFPGDMARVTSMKVPTQTAFGEIAKVVTTPDEPIIAYTFQNLQYITANRLPASGHFFLLPWQVKYNESSRFGIRSDPCDEIKATRPKVMMLDKWKVWDRFEWASYGGCIQAFADSDYQQLSDPNIYVSRDVSLDDFGIAAAGVPSVVAPSEELAFKRALGIHLSPRHQKDRRRLVRVGILFGTYSRTNFGEAELRLVDEKGQVATQRFSLQTLEDNAYRYFDVEPRRYQRGELVALDGAGVSAYEVRNPESEVATCAIYEYSEGHKRFTPGCPFL